MHFVYDQIEGKIFTFRDYRGAASGFSNAAHHIVIEGEKRNYNFQADLLADSPEGALEAFRQLALKQASNCQGLGYRTLDAARSYFTSADEWRRKVHDLPAIAPDAEAIE